VCVREGIKLFDVTSMGAARGKDLYSGSGTPA
jgi:hypothetical protein